MRSQYPFARAHARAAGLLVIIASVACSDSVTSPAHRRPTVSPRPTLAAFSIPRTPSSTRYRVTGLKPATGRSGTAQVTARAMIGKDGNTLLEITTGELDVASTPPGTLTKAQVKLLDPNDLGITLSTANFLDLTAGHFAQTFGGLAPTYPLQIQANVKGIDGNRTDVVTTIERVKLRPDLAVTLGTLGNALVRVPTQIAATIRELNGDLGAAGDCILIVDGATVDQAPGIWVDAGDAVSCVFMHAFATAGSHTVEVRMTGVAPGDWDTANNAAMQTVAVLDPSVRPSYWSVSAWQRTYQYDRRANGFYRSLLAPTTTGYWERTFDVVDRHHVEDRQVVLYGSGDPIIAFPLQSFGASFETDGHLIQAGQVTGPLEPNLIYIDDGSQWGDPNYYWEQACVYRGDPATAMDGGPAGRIYWNVCSNRWTYDGGTTWNRHSDTYVTQYAGTVTYWSSGFNRYVVRGSDGALSCPTSSCYTWNDYGVTTTGDLQYLTLGDNVRARFSVVDADGIRVGVDETITLTPFTYQVNVPYACREGYDSYFNARYVYCEEYSVSEVGKRGNASQY